MADQEAHVAVHVHKAEALKNTQFFGEQVRRKKTASHLDRSHSQRCMQDPYALCTFLPHSSTTVRTLPAQSGGTAPTWTKDHECELCLSLTEYRASAGSDNPACTDPSHILIQLWNSNVAVDDFIGSATISLSDALEAPADTIHKLELDTGGHLFVSVSREGDSTGRSSFLSGSGLQNSFVQVLASEVQIKMALLLHYLFPQDLKCIGVGQRKWKWQERTCS
jgi:hypothetical protein